MSPGAPENHLKYALAFQVLAKVIVAARLTLVACRSLLACIAYNLRRRRRIFWAAFLSPMAPIAEAWSAARSGRWCSLLRRWCQGERNCPPTRLSLAITRWALPNSVCGCLLHWCLGAAAAHIYIHVYVYIQNYKRADEGQKCEEASLGRAWPHSIKKGGRPKTKKS